MKICYDRSAPSEFHLEGGGIVKYMEYDKAIWVWDAFCEKRGTGTRLAKAFIAFAKRKGKSIYGTANPQKHISKMDINRLKRWYHLLGAKDIKMEDNPTAMMLEVKSGKG